MESTFVRLRRRLREAGPSSWPDINRATGISQSTLKKYAYLTKKASMNLRLAEALTAYFEALDTPAPKRRKVSDPA